jgi:hypothetical protein
MQQLRLRRHGVRLEEVNLSQLNANVLELFRVLNSKGGQMQVMLEANSQVGNET